MLAGLSEGETAALRNVLNVCYDNVSGETTARHRI
jgi:hypothetical protein